MPVIPQSSFDTNPSTRVGVNQQQVGPSNFSKVSGATSQAMGAFQQLIDQEERTEAYNKAGEVRASYLNKRVVFNEALSNISADGMAEYVDPSDTNPDVTKRRRVRKHIDEIYKDMNDTYEEGRKNLSNLARGDIADSVAENHVRVNLLRDQTNMAKAKTRAAQKGAETQFLDVIDLGFANILETSVDISSSPQKIDLTTTNAINQIHRDFKDMNGVFGTEGSVKMLQYMDKRLENLATNIISQGGVNERTIRATNKVVANIKDPRLKSLASSRLERFKKNSSEQSAVTAFKQADEIRSNVDNAPVLKDDDYLNVANSTKKILDVYIDPKYNQVATNETKFQAASGLMSSALASRMMVDMVDDDFSILDEFDTNRTPSSTGEPTKPSERSESFKKMLADEISTTGLDPLLASQPNLKQAIIDQTIQKMRQKRDSGFLQENMASIVAAKYPTAKGMELTNMINSLSNRHSLGTVSLVDANTQKAFAGNFKEAMNKSPMEALLTMEGFMQAGGQDSISTDSTRRGYAMDLVSKTPQYSYVVPVSEISPRDRETFIEEARLYKENLKELENFTEAKLERQMSALYNAMPALHELRDSAPSYYKGIKQMVIHKAAALAHQSGEKNPNPASYVKDAVKEVSKHYASRKVGNSTIFAVNGNGKDYSSLGAGTLDIGVNRAVKMHHIPKEERIDMLKEVMSEQDFKSLNIRPEMPDSALDMLVSNLVSIQPSPRNPNLHMYTINGKPISRKQKVFTIDMDTLKELGSTQSDMINRIGAGSKL